ncbi:Rap1a/Tai family immunity protein [Methylobacterium sp. A49B]
MKPLAAVLALALLTTPVDAKNLDGERLHEMCASPDLSLYVAYYAAGLAQGAALAKQNNFCIPTTVNMQQMADVACKFVALSQNTWQHSAGTVVANSFSNTWPCPKR